jgi:FKBP-type peptidyl-prolyl cis-trans isomerase FkpA
MSLEGSGKRPGRSQFWISLGLIALVSGVGAYYFRKPEVPVRSQPTKPDPIVIEDLTIGSGAVVEEESRVKIHYEAYLVEGRRKYDSSYDRKQPFEFTLGKHDVIRAWETGILGMKVGGKRRLTVPPQFGFGDQGLKGLVPPGARLIFEIELLAAKTG